jgi:acetyl esterase/lipase
LKLAYALLAISLAMTACVRGTARPAVVPETAAPSSTVPAPTSTVVPLPTAALLPGAQAGAVLHDVTYCTVEGVELKMDVYFPDSFTSPAPAVVYVHGGGWSSGDKRQAAEIGSGLQEHAFIVISLNYRLAPEYAYPAQIEDVKCAVRHLRANAGAYGLDPARIGAVGTSAGAHLAAMLGLTDETAGWDTGLYLEQSSQVAAVAVLYAPTDLTQQFPGVVSAIGESVFGATAPDDIVLVEASPITYVTADDPPFLLIHGARDNFVPPAQSQILYDRLIAAGVPAELVFVENGGHAFLQSDAPVVPSREELIARIAQFFELNLK